jgi:nucleotide-binding universal stress UspA family protein
MLSTLFARRRKAPTVQPHSEENLLPRFRKLVVPAAGAPFSNRVIRKACRLARMNPDAEVHLVYLIEVPRAFALAASLPGDEAMADDVLSSGRRATEHFGVNVVTEIQRGREFGEALLKYIAQQDCDLIILGVLSDGSRGLPLPLAREVYDRAGIPAILDYITGTRPAEAIVG